MSDCFPSMEIRTLLGKRVAVVYVDELAADRKYTFFNGTAYRRILTGDHRITDRDIEAQEEFKEEASHAKELQPVPGMTEADLDMAKLNQFIFHLNQPTPVETLKPDLASARAFLERRCFLKDGAVTILGALVCCNHPGDRLGSRSHIHGYVDIPQQIAQDKQDCRRHQIDQRPAVGGAGSGPITNRLDAVLASHRLHGIAKPLQNGVHLVGCHGVHSEFAIAVACVCCRGESED